MRIGILGGTFNPVHNGHIIIGKDVTGKLNLNKLIYVPAYFPPHKTTDKFDIIDAEHRYKMVQLAIEDNPYFEVSDIDISLQGISYSIRTIRELKKKYNIDDKPYFFVGSDSINEFNQWKDMDKILEESNFYIMHRAGYSLSVENIPKGANTIKVRAINISATKIRNNIRNNLSIKELVPEKIENYILANKLYSEI